MDPGVLKKAHAVFSVDLHPSKLHDVRGGVQEHINTLLMRYNEDFGGVVMCVGNFTVLSDQAPVNLYFPLFRVRVRAPVVVFMPQRGSLLTGRVTKVGTDFIGLLVLGVLNASIPKALVRPEFTCSRMAPLEWRSQKQPKHIIRVGSHVKFHVDRMQDPGGFFSIYGSLKAKGTGAVDFVGAGRLPRPSAEEGTGNDGGEVLPRKKSKAAKAAKASTPDPAPASAALPSMRLQDPQASAASLFGTGELPGSLKPPGSEKKAKKDKKDKKEKRRKSIQ